MRNFQEVISNITDNVQNISKIFGAAYEISLMIVTPNKLSAAGSLILESDSTDPIVQLD